MFITRATRLLALSLGLLTSLGEASAAIASPSLIIHHAVVLSQDPTNPVAEAVAVLQGRIVAIGTDTEVLALRGPNTRVVDAGGRALVPGFNDAHLHPRHVLMQAAYLDRMEAAGLQSGWGNDWVRLAGIKVVHGNSLSGRTCWLSKPYDRINPATGQRDYFGIPPARSQDELDALILRIHRAGLQPAVHANGASQQVSVETALRMWTVGGAYATRQESDKGSIRPGLLADFVLLAADPRKVAPTSIKDVRVDATFVGGEMVYARPGFPTPR